MVGPWKQCKVLKRLEDIGNNKFYVVEFCNDRTRRDVASYELAENVVPTDDELERGTRAIATRRTEELPYKQNARGHKIELYSSNPNEFYPGIVAARHADGRYLVFFDDGMVQYVSKSHIRRVLGNDSHNHGVYDFESIQIFRLFFIEFLFLHFCVYSTLECKIIF